LKSLIITPARAHGGGAGRLHLKTSSFKGLATHFRAIQHLVPNCGKSCQSLQECLVLPKPQMFAETQRSVVKSGRSQEEFSQESIYLRIHRECNNTFRGWIKSASWTPVH